MAAFGELVGRFDADSGRRREQFAGLCRWFLTHAPVYAHQLRRVWLWKDWPGRYVGETGIDLVAEDRRGHLWAITATPCDAAAWITQRDAQAFLAAAGRAPFAFGLLIATTDLIGRTAQHTIETARKPAGLVLLGDLDAADLDWPVSPAVVRARRWPPHRPRPHQRDAISAVVTGFARADRGQLIMARGTGRTLTALFLHDTLGAERTLVLVPSLSWLAHTLRVWTANTPVDFDFLPVCTGGTGPEADAVVENTSDLGLPVTVDPGQIATFLRRRSGRRVVFATHQGAPAIAEAFRPGRVPAFDLVIAVEASCGAGRDGFATLGTSEAIRARRRLFLTGSDRDSPGRVPPAATETAAAVTYDDVAFGPVFHRLGIAEAIEANLLTDYRVVVAGIDDHTCRQWAARSGRSITTAEGADARRWVGYLALAAAMQRHDLHRTITVHSSVGRAREFARTLPEVIAGMPVRRRPTGRVWSDHVSGQMPTGQRRARGHHLARLGPGDRGVLAHAGCLTDGAGVLDCDSVAFLDPPRSGDDLLRAVDHALRPATGKTVGTIVIPVFLDTDTDPATAVGGAALEPVWEVIRVLRSHDEQLGARLDELRRRVGRCPRRRPPLPRRIRLDLPAGVGVEFAHAFAVRLLEQTTADWEYWFGLVERFVEHHGHARVPVSCTVDGDRLGAWVNRQRTQHTHGALDADRARRLQNLPGWTWEPHADLWEQGYRRLVEFVEHHGHARVSTTSGDRIGAWVSQQRHTHAHGALDADRAHRLQNLPGWIWEPHADLWEQGYRRLVDFVEQHGHARVPPSYTVDGYWLGSWVTTQRAHQVKGTLDPDRGQRLHNLPGWTIDPAAALWEEGYRRLVDFVEHHGHARVPYSYTVDGHGLGVWVTAQRAHHVKGTTLDPDRGRRLQTLPGWTWDPFADQWEEGYRRLSDFVAQHGHCRVPKSYTIEGYRLGAWVNKQRTRRTAGTLAADREHRLQAVPGWTWTSSRPNHS
ncbi:Helicase associated domain protein (plasmid) [Rhodococcus sp. ZPP]|uniref:DEAD/DEAH box helicase n=1 Tax=Rhodococcus sp. ZPP TaxID=2749906 RepID=UPI001AD86674|nr:DEAD/DEAH box helicase [Rhodococcus sp. ZPP]QTJ71273.1 Helicase associated domain protein [Rhodococcus sp. ZPP]